MSSETTKAAAAAGGPAGGARCAARDEHGRHCPPAAAAGRADAQGVREEAEAVHVQARSRPGPNHMAVEEAAIQ